MSFAYFAEFAFFVNRSCLALPKINNREGGGHYLQAAHANANMRIWRYKIHTHSGVGPLWPCAHAPGFVSISLRYFADWGRQLIIARASGFPKF
jgi:hypothetical protein